jgi:uncharacterized protein
MQSGLIRRLLYVSDIHGSERCWNKLLNAGPFYQADTILLGGDITGKGLQAIVKEGAGRWRADYEGKTRVFSSEDALRAFENQMRATGLYPFRTTKDEFNEIVNSSVYKRQVSKKLILESLTRWLEKAEERLKKQSVTFYAGPGNDDPFFIDQLFASSNAIVWVDRKKITLDSHHEMIYEGHTNPTPWRTWREMEEDDLLAALEKQIEKLEDDYNAIFALHAPPYKSKLDDAPGIDGDMVGRQGAIRHEPVGSRAVRRVIEMHQPLLSLHGHVHEGKGAISIGRTLCVNPGSLASQGALAGYLINFSSRGIKSYQPVLG